MIIKRGFDILSSVFVLILVFPLLLSVSLVIWLTMGLPVIFIQPRLGYQGKPFNIYKFRTMTRETNVDGSLLDDETRLTNLGKILRNTTLDELPELINVLKGDMSVVGPRPLLIEYGELYTKEQWRRHEMLPGMAGPVLAARRNLLSWEEKFERDIWYVENWSLWLDITILFRTACKVIKREGTSADGYATMPKFTGTDLKKD